MKHNRLNKLWVLALTLILAITLPGFIAAMDLGAQLGDLQTKLVGLKGKLGQLKGGLEKLKDALDGKAPSGGGSGLTINSGLGVLDWVQVTDVEALKKLIVVEAGSDPSVGGVVKTIKTALSTLQIILSQPNNNDAEKSIVNELNNIEKNKEKAAQFLPIFLKKLTIKKTYLENLENQLKDKKNPMVKIEKPTQSSLAKLKDDIVRLNKADLEQIYNDLNDELFKLNTATNMDKPTIREAALKKIEELSNKLVSEDPRTLQRQLEKLNNTSLSELQKELLKKYYDAATFLDNNVSHADKLKSYKKTFSAIIQITDVLSQKIEADTASSETKTVAEIISEILTTLGKDTTLINTDNVTDLATLFAITPAQIKDDTERANAVYAVFEKLIDNTQSADKGDSKINLAKTIVRLNLDIFIQFKNGSLGDFPLYPSIDQAKFDKAFNDKIKTVGIDWYNKFKTKVDTTIGKINPATSPTAGSKIKTVLMLVTDGMPSDYKTATGSEKKAWLGRSEKPLQALYVGLSEAEKENRAVALRGLIGTFSAANIINDAKTLCDNMAGIDKLTADEKTSLRDKIILLTTKADLDKINKALERGNLSVILKRLGATNDQITDRGLALPSEKPPSGPKKSPGSTDATDTKTSEVSDVETAKTKIRDIIIAKLPTPPPPPPPPGSPWDVSSWKELDDTEIQTIIDNRSVITSKPPIHPALKPVMEKQKAKFSGKGADGLAVLTALGITP